MLTRSGMQLPVVYETRGKSAAVFSPCRGYRYALSREWGEGTKLVVIGLNPSTADAHTDDPTIRRCTGFARRWGFSGLVMLNLFAYRATEPRAMKAAADPIGPVNDTVLTLYATPDRMVVAAWGIHGVYRGRQAEVRHMMSEQCVALHHLGLTAGGFPKHPLYLRADTQAEAWI